MSNLAIKPEQKYTYADYKTWNDDERWEIIEGVPYKMDFSDKYNFKCMSPAPMRVHQKISGNLFRKIGNHLEGKPCQVYAAPFDVRFLDYEDQSDEAIETVVQPDIIVVCDEKKLTDYGCKGVPDIVIEILSPSTYKVSG